MQALFLYLLKMIGCSGVLLCYYVMFLRNKKFHQYNRFYLLLTVIISFVLPVLNISIPWLGDVQAPIYMQTLDIISVDASVSVMPADSLTGVGIIAFGFYFLISGYMLVRLIKSLWTVRLIVNKYSSEQIDSILFYNTDEANTPFSFTNKIFWNKQLPLHSEKGQQVFRHELYHVMQRHSMDIILMQLVLVFAWINPFFHIIKKELATIHEFLADQFAVSDSDRYAYAEFLVMNAIDSKHISVTHHFFNSSLKRRITMILLNSGNNRFSYVARIMSVPLVILLFCSVALKAEISVNDTTIVNPPLVSVQEKTKTPSAIADTEPEYPGGQQAWRNYLNKTFKYPKKAIDANIQGTVMLRFLVSSRGDVSKVEAVSGPEKGGLREEAIRVIKKSGPWTAAVRNGNAVTAYKNLPITFRLSSD